MDIHYVYCDNADYLDQHTNDDFKHRLGNSRYIRAVGCFYTYTNFIAKSKALLQDTKPYQAAFSYAQAEMMIFYFMNLLCNALKIKNYILHLHP